MWDMTPYCIQSLHQRLDTITSLPYTIIIPLLNLLYTTIWSTTIYTHHPAPQFTIHNHLTNNYTQPSPCSSISCIQSLHERLYTLITPLPNQLYTIFWLTTTYTHHLAPQSTQYKSLHERLYTIITPLLNLLYVITPLTAMLWIKTITNFLIPDVVRHVVCRSHSTRRSVIRTKTLFENFVSRNHSHPDLIPKIELTFENLDGRNSNFENVESRNSLILRNVCVGVCVLRILILLIFQESARSSVYSIHSQRSVIGTKMLCEILVFVNISIRISLLIFKSQLAPQSTLYTHRDPWLGPNAVWNSSTCNHFNQDLLLSRIVLNFDCRNSQKSARYSVYSRRSL